MLEATHALPSFISLSTFQSSPPRLLGPLMPYHAPITSTFSLLSYTNSPKVLKLIYFSQSDHYPTVSLPLQLTPWSHNFPTVPISPERTDFIMAVYILKNIWSKFKFLIYFKNLIEGLIWTKEIYIAETKWIVNPYEFSSDGLRGIILNPKVKRVSVFLTPTESP